MKKILLILTLLVTSSASHAQGLNFKNFTSDTLIELKVTSEMLASRIKAVLKIGSATPKANSEIYLLIGEIHATTKTFKRSASELAPAFGEMDNTLTQTLHFIETESEYLYNISIDSSLSETVKLGSVSDRIEEMRKDIDIALENIDLIKK